jgi:hypothetical protein
MCEKVKKYMGYSGRQEFELASVGHEPNKLNLYYHFLEQMRIELHVTYLQSKYFTIKLLPIIIKARRNTNPQKTLMRGYVLPLNYG